MLADWQAGINDARRQIGKTINVGTTEFTLGFLGRVWQRVVNEFEAREIELNVLHVRTKDAFTRLEAKEVDLLCCGFAATSSTDDIPHGYEFLPWRREKLVLLTNLSRRELPVPAVSADRLPQIPLVLPSGGVVIDFLRRWYGNDFRNKLIIAATIDDIYYGLALLRSKLAHGCMLVSAGIGAAAIEGRLPGAPEFRLVNLGSGFHPTLELVTGTFGRKGERELFTPSHPLNLLWRAFGEEVANGAPYTL